MTAEWTVREYVLREARRKVVTQRQQQYGDPQVTLGHVCELWNAYLADSTLTPADVAVMMALLKVARIAHDSGGEDHYIDAVGYLSLAAELAWQHGEPPSAD